MFPSTTDVVTSDCPSDIKFIGTSKVTARPLRPLVTPDPAVNSSERFHVLETQHVAQALRLRIRREHKPVASQQREHHVADRKARRNQDRVHWLTRPEAQHHWEIGTLAVCVSWDVEHDQAMLMSAAARHRTAGMRREKVPGLAGDAFGL